MVRHLLESDGNLKEIPCGIVISNRLTGHNICLKATTDEAKQLWLKEIKRIANEWRRDNVKQLKSRFELGTSDFLVIPHSRVKEGGDPKELRQLEKFEKKVKVSQVKRTLTGRNHLSKRRQNFNLKSKE
jgi:hypothetical protein